MSKYLGDNFLKIFIWGGILSVLWSEILFYGSGLKIFIWEGIVLVLHNMARRQQSRKTNFQP